MSHFLDIEQALINAVLSIDNVTPCSWPDAELSDSDKPADFWLAFANMRGKSTSITVGSAGEDEHRGVMQIDVNYPKGRGSSHAVRKGTEFCKALKAGRSFTHNGQTVTILGAAGLSPGKYVGNYYRVTVSVTYYARTSRI